jgi:copper(I)-binding protein
VIARRLALALGRPGWPPALVALAVLLLGGCVYYPTIMDAGGTRIRTENGRAVRDGVAALVYFDVNSTGKYGDTLLGAAAPLARQARLIAGGTPVDRLEIPGATTVKFGPGGPHVLLADLQRPLVKGESFIVTLQFEKSGGIGVVTVVE